VAGEAFFWAINQADYLDGGSDGKTPTKHTTKQGPLGPPSTMAQIQGASGGTQTDWLYLRAMRVQAVKSKGSGTENRGASSGGRGELGIGH